jgi:hypothetical protein
MNFTRREFVCGTAAGAVGCFLPDYLQAADPPIANPASHLDLGWTASLSWDQVLDVTTISGNGRYWDGRLKKAQEVLAARGGGVV